MGEETLLTLMNVHVSLNGNKIYSNVDELFIVWSMGISCIKGPMLKSGM